MYSDDYSSKEIKWAMGSISLKLLPSRIGIDRMHLDIPDAPPAVALRGTLVR